MKKMYVESDSPLGKNGARVKGAGLLDTELLSPWRDHYLNVILEPVA